MKHIVVSECYDEIWISEEAEENTITEVQAKELEQLIISSQLNESNVIWGRRKITFINYVGFIRCKTFTIEILPKVSVSDNKNLMRKSLLNMLIQSGYFKVKPSELSQLQLMKGNLFEIFGGLYAELLLKELKRGVFSNYTNIENNLPMLKGSLQISRNIKENISRNRKHLVYCKYDEHVIDNPLNQIFILVNDLLIRNVSNNHTINKLKQCNHYLDEVTYRIFSKEELNHIVLNRTNSRYEASLLLAKQFLRNNTATTNKSNQNSFSILFEMNDLFEKYVATMVRISTDYIVYTQHNKYKLFINEQTSSPNYELRPDIVVENQGRQLIIDTKWKSVNNTKHRHGAKRDDLFQMYAYITRYDRAGSAILLYPYHEQLKNDHNRVLESWRLEENLYKKVRMYTINLETSEKTCNDLTKIIHDNL